MCHFARFISKIIVKADGLEVHYRTSKPSAINVSSNTITWWVDQQNISKSEMIMHFI